MTTIQYTDELVVVTCWCGMNHAIPANLDDFQARQFRDGKAQTEIYCPLGHVHIRAGEGEAVRLRRRLEQEQDATKRALRQRDSEQRAHSATKGQLTRARRRAAAGVCPCCHRSFVQLPRHIASRHPDYDPTKDKP